MYIYTHRNSFMYNFSSLLSIHSMYLILITSRGDEFLNPSKMQVFSFFLNCFSEIFMKHLSNVTCLKFSGHMPVVKMTNSSACLLFFSGLLLTA